MRIVCLQHIDYEGPEKIAEWAASRGHRMQTVLPVFGEYPDPAEVDMLVVMGGPMSAYDEHAHPWLVDEKRFIAQCVTAGCRVLGVCLGCQLLAEALGGRARRHTVREVGWFPVHHTAAGQFSRIFEVIPEGTLVGQWHGDTFDLPPGVKTALSTGACPNQAFECCGGRVVGLQFHLEWTTSALVRLVEHHGDWLAATAAGTATVQPAETVLGSLPALARGNDLLFALLDRMQAA